MSDLSVTLAALERSRSQLSVHAYFDAELYRREMACIFDQSPQYLGHELSVPEIGDFHRAARWCARRAASS
jgi:phenylpropionate dioxygenase-like ring-hydroxylating dioxygenase large terminal subunit